MHLRRVILKNIGPHRDLDVTFQLGLVGILGANGTGKSTLLDATYAGFTNDWKRFEGERGANINTSAGAEEEAFVSIEAEHEGVGFTLVRGLRPASRRLEIEGERTVYTKDADITVQLETRLGLNRRLIDDYIFVRQRGMFGFLDETPSARAESFAHLCRTTRAADAFKACGVVIDSLGKDDVEIEATDDLKAAIHTAVQELASANEKVEELDAKVLSASDLKIAKESIEHRRLFLWHTENQERIAGQLLLAESHRKKFIKEVKQYEEIVSALESKINDSLKPAADAAEQLIECWERYRTWEKQYTNAQSVVLMRTAELAECQEPEAPVEALRGEGDAVELRAKYRQELVSATELLETFKDSGLAACPTCGTKVAAFGERIKAAEARVSQLPEEIDKLTKQIKEVKAYRQAVHNYDVALVGCQTRLSAAQQRLTDCEASPVKKPATPENSCAGALDAYQTALRSLKMEKLGLTGKQRLLDQSQTAYDAATAAIVAEEKATEAHVVTDKRYNMAVQFLKEHEAALIALGPLRERVRVAEHKLEEAREALKRAKTLQSRYAKRKHAIALLGQLRERVFHHSKLARLVAEGNLAAVEGDLNEQLELFGSPFRAEVSEGLTFRVTFPGEPAISAGRLSGGQKGVFAMAFRPAFASLFGADDDMMALDEPSDGLDSTNLPYMRDALSALANKVRGRRQVIVITHAELLLPAFDQIVRIGG